MPSYELLKDNSESCADAASVVREYLELHRISEATVLFLSRLCPPALPVQFLLSFPVVLLCVP